MSIVTKKGDDGTTGLLMGDRVLKCHPRIKTIGAIDELNAHLGICRSFYQDDDEFNNRILDIQLNLVQIMGELAVNNNFYERWEKSTISLKKITNENLIAIETYIKDLEKELPSFKDWAAPGKSLLSAQFDLATRVCRRAEREIIEMNQLGEILRLLIQQYINRLSDYLWILARFID